MSQPAFQVSPIQPGYYWQHLAPKVMLLCSWWLAFVTNGGTIPRDAMGWSTLIATVILVLLDGSISIAGAGKMAPPKKEE